VHCVVGYCAGNDDSAPIYFAPLCTSRRHCNGHCEADSYPGLVQTSPITCNVIMFRSCAQRESDCRGQIVGTSTNSGGKLVLGGSSHSFANQTKFARQAARWGETQPTYAQTQTPIPSDEFPTLTLPLSPTTYPALHPIRHFQSPIRSRRLCDFVFSPVTAVNSPTPCNIIECISLVVLIASWMQKLPFVLPLRLALRYTCWAFRIIQRCTASLLMI
jgi:hypothetical protein